MDSTVTLGGAANQTLVVLGEAFFKWIPGTFASVIGTSDAGTTYAWPTNPITTAVTPGQVTDYLGAVSSAGVYDQLFDVWYIVVTVSMIASLLLTILIAYSLWRTRQIRAAEARHFAATAHPVAARSASRITLRWERIVEQAQSDNEQGWRLAILEADILLNELLDTLGYKGETMADKMRAVERADFKTIDLAWEAHRSRNRVAHEGSALSLSEREVRRVIGLYEQIFREFKFLA